MAPQDGGAGKVIWRALVAEVAHAGDNHGHA